MNLKPTKKKVIWSIIISILGTILSLYLISSDIIYQTGIEDISIGALRSIGPSGITYLIIFFILSYIILFIVIYIIWSFLEKE